MSRDHNGEAQPTSSNPNLGWGASVEERYKKIKEHAETYPYVWASYAVVYGVFGLWFTYRWRKLRKKEDTIRGLQQRLRKLVEAEDSAISAEKASTSPVDKLPK